MYMPFDGKVPFELSLDETLNTRPYYKINIPKEEPKQETLEEAKQRVLKDNYVTANDGDIFEMGAKWQAERMYSEEEVIDLLQKMNDWPTICEGRSDIEEWFEQFKKK
jgi:hypothetical protein